MPSWSSVDTYKRWRYAVEHDFHGLDDPAIDLETVNLTYDSCHHFFPFSRNIENSAIRYTINQDETWLAVVVNTDVDLYNIRTGRRGVLVGHVDPISQVAFIPGQSTKLVSWSESTRGDPLSPPRHDIVFWDIDKDMKEEEMEKDEVRRVREASKSSVEQLQNLLDKQNLRIELKNAEKGNVSMTLAKALNQIIRQRSIDGLVKLSGRLASHFQSQSFNHAGDTLIYLPGPRPRSNGDDQWDIGLYHMPSGGTKILEGHRDAIMWMGFSPDDTLVVSACWDGTFRVWDPETGVQKFKWVTDKQNWTGAFSPDGTQFLGTDGNGAIRIWDLNTGEIMAKYESGRRWRRHLDWSCDGRYIAVGGDSAGQILIFDAHALTDEAGEMVPVQKRVLDTEAVSDDEMIRRMVLSSLAVTEIVWARSGRRLISRTYGEVVVEIVDFDVNVKWRIMPFEPTDDQEADWERLPKSTRKEPFRPGYSYLASLDEVALVCHDGVRFWKL